MAIVTPTPRIGRFAGATLPAAKPTNVFAGTKRPKQKSRKATRKSKRVVAVTPGLINR